MEANLTKNFEREDIFLTGSEFVQRIFFRSVVFFQLKETQIALNELLIWPCGEGQICNVGHASQILTGKIL